MQGIQAHIQHWLRSEPTIGDLATLCEENYRQLHGLAPQLAVLTGRHRSSRPDHQDLVLTVVSQAPYTTLLRLTYEFSESHGPAEPDALLRVYHDAQMVEVEDLRQHTLPTDRLFEAPGLLNKWRANLFVSKWLAFCLQQQHLFVADVNSTYALMVDVQFVIAPAELADLPVIGKHIFTQKTW